jgi:uncharacterized membrane protein
MKTFKQLIYTFTLFSVVLLTYRIIKSEELSYIFLAWNLFLAFIPWWISDYMKRQEKLTYIHFPIILLWLLFLPNAPYILTDLFHLKPRPDLPLWYDLILVLSFALTGVMVFFKSLKDMLTLLSDRMGQFYVTIITPVLFWLVAYGLYLGRYLRFNSWDIVHPFRLLKASFGILFEKDTIGFTGIFAVFMWFLYVMISNFNQREEV